jgi:hypothetical protein
VRRQEPTASDPTTFAFRRRRMRPSSRSNTSHPPSLRAHVSHRGRPGRGAGNGFHQVPRRGATRTRRTGAEKESRSWWVELASNIRSQNRPCGWLDFTKSHIGGRPGRGGRQTIFTKSQPGGDPDAARGYGSSCEGGVRHVIVNRSCQPISITLLVKSPPSPGETPRKLMGKNCRRGLTLSAS